MARPTLRLFHLVLESHDGRALVPIPKRSTSPRATSTLQRWVDSLKALDPNRPIREADMDEVTLDVRFVPIGDIEPATRLPRGLPWQGKVRCSHERTTEKRTAL